jgi:DNA-binding MarR family transcriptional regulator
LIVVNQSAVDDWLALGQTLRAIQATKGDFWPALHLTMAQLKVALLVVQSGGLSSRSIADRLHIGPSAVTPLVDRLVDLKLARREPDAADRRVVYVRPSPKAIALYDSLLQSGRALLAEVLDEVPRADRDDVRRALALLRESANRIYARTKEETAAR